MNSSYLIIIIGIGGSFIGLVAMEHENKKNMSNATVRLSISPLQKHEVAATKKMIMQVVFEVLRCWPSLEELEQWSVTTKEFVDIDNFEEIYAAKNKGLFLVLKDEEQIVGSMAVKKLDKDTCEIRRGWILPAYRGYGFGSELMHRLITFSVEQKYKYMRSDTWEPDRQPGAIASLKKFGFYEIAPYKNSPAKFFMEKQLSRL